MEKKREGVTRYFVRVPSYKLFYKRKYKVLRMPILDSTVKNCSCSRQKTGGWQKEQRS